MRISLRKKLIVAFTLVVLIPSAAAAIVGVHLLGARVVKQAQEKVNMDLNSAREIYDTALREVKILVECTALRRFGVRNALKENNTEMLLQALRKAMEQGSLDILTITDSKGSVVLRARNPAVFGDSQAHDEMITAVLRDKKALGATEIITREELLKESQELAARARMKLVSTPNAKPNSETKRTSGMLLKAAVPVLDDDGSLLGVLYGGTLLNRNCEIVDKTKDIVYRGAKYKGKDIGTATIFQGDLRISTNVKTRDGRRAVGTRVSEEVFNKVVREGTTWKERAFVVNDWYLAAYEPIRNVSGEVIGILYVGVLEQKYSDMKRSTLWTFLGITFAGIAISLVIATILSNAAVRPVLRLKKGFEAIADGNFDFEVTCSTSDEISSLTRSFNRVRLQLKDLYQKLKGRIDAADEDLKKAYKMLRDKQKQLVHSEKLAALGTLAAGIAHEVNNPLGVASMYAQMSQKDAGNESSRLQKRLETVVSEIDRAGRILKNLLEFARQTEPNINDIDLNALIEKSFSIIEHQAKLQEIEVIKDLQSTLPLVPADSDKLQQVFVNMAINALQAMPDGGKLAFSTRNLPDDKSVKVRISDTGLGIPEEHIMKLFDPFFTTKETGKGTGLGLSVSHGIIEQHGGSIHVESSVGKGTTFTILLPVETLKE